MRVLRMGAEGPDVERVQAALNEIFEDQLLVDGFFGVKTQEMVEAFQDDQGLNVDGIVGPITWRKLFNEEPPQPKISLPIMQRDLMGLMGDPHDPTWRAAWLTFIDLTKFVNQHGLPKNGLEFRDGKYGFWGNKLMAKAFLLAMQNLVDSGCIREWKTFDGCWCVRPMKSGNSLSVHAFAMAVDINAALNPYNSSRHQFSNDFVNCFARAGFESGGMWSSPKDWMHFQLAWNRRSWEADLEGTGLEAPHLMEV